MLKSLFGELKSILIFMIEGFLFVVFMSMALAEKGCIALQEQDLASSQYNIGVPSYEIKQWGTMVDVTATAPIHATHKITDFKATATLYDCPEKTSPISDCSEVGSDYYLFDDTIKPNSTYQFNTVFNYYNVNSTGVLVPKLVFTGFQG